MDRREFLLDVTSKGAGIMSIPLLDLSHVLFQNKRMGIVVHSYASRWNSKTASQKYPGFTNAIELIEHCYAIGAGGVQVVVKDWTADFARKIRDRREKLGLYLEGSIALPGKAEDVARFEREVVNALEAGAAILRTVTSGRRYEVLHTPDEVNQFKKSAIASLQWAEPILKKHKVKLAIENHKDWKANELVTALKQLDSEWIGVTLDFGNSISLLEDPMEVVETLAPYVFTTHAKDMGVDEYESGFLLSEVPLGKGILDLTRIVALCKQHNPVITFNLEMITRDPLEIPCLKDDYWAVMADTPGYDLARTLRMVRQNKPKVALPKVSQLTSEERLAAEEQNILESLAYSKEKLGLD